MMYFPQICSEHDRFTELLRPPAKKCDQLLKMINGLHLYSAFIAPLSKALYVYIAPLSKALYVYIAPLSKALYVYLAPLSKALYNLCLIYPFAHTLTHSPMAIGCRARCQPARQEQSGVRCLAQGHLDTPRVGSNRQPSSLLSHIAPFELSGTVCPM